MDKKCPFKKKIVLSDRNDWTLLNIKDLAKVNIDFGECDERKCMAYDPSLGKCKKLN